MAGPGRTITPLPKRFAQIRPKTYRDMLTDRSDSEETQLRGLVGKAFDGKLNTTGEVTLATGGATTTDIDDPRISTTTVAVLTPLNQNAASSMSTVWQAVQSPGKIRLNHAASALTRTFAFVLIGMIVLFIAIPASAQSPTVIGIPQASDPACVTGEYQLSVNSSSTKWKKCENGVITDLDTTGGGGGTSLDQSAGETDLRYDATLEGYYYDTDGGGTRATDGTEPFVDTHVIEVPGDYATVQAALNSTECGKGTGAGVTSQGCRIRIAKGTYAESFEIGGTNAEGNPEAQNSIIIEGVGPGGAEDGAGGNQCGVTLTGDNTLDNSVIKLNRTIGVSLRNLCIDMDDATTNDPKFGIWIGYEQNTTKFVTVENVSIDGGTVSGGAGIMIGNSGAGGFHTDSPFVYLRMIKMYDVQTCLIVDSEQSVGMMVDALECSRPKATVGGVSFGADGGEFTLRNFYMSPGAANQTGINVANNALGTTVIEHPTFEWNQTNGTLIDFNATAGTGSGRTVSIIGGRFVMQAATGTRECIDFKRVGTLNVIGVTFESQDAGYTCTVSAANPSATKQSILNWHGNDTLWNATFSDMIINESSAGGDMIVNRQERGDHYVGESGTTVYEGATLDAFETTVTVTDPTADRTMTIPNANSNPVIPDTGAANNFLTAISSAGVISKAQPDFTNISGTATDGQVDGTLETDEVVGTETDEALCSWEATGARIECDLTVNAGTSLTADLEEETHASEHQNGGGDEVATATAAANAIPKAGAGARLDSAWLDADLEAIAALATTAFGRGVLDDADAAALRTTADAQQLDADLTSVAALTTTTGGRSILATTPADDQVYVGDSASAGTWRTIPDCGEAGTLNYTQATNSFSCLTDSGGGGGGNSVDVTLNFSTGSEIASVVVTGQAWVASGSEIVCAPTMTATADRAEGAEDAVIEGLVVSAHSRVVGTGFTVTGAPRFGNAYGQFSVHCIGV